MEREAAIAAAVDAVRQRWGAHSLTRGPLVGHQPGRGPSAARDGRLRPPWWPGAPEYARPNVLELAGPPSCGKLSLALLWLAALPTGGTVAVVDEAGSFYPPAALACGLPLERLVVVRPPERRAAREATALLLGSAGFDAVLWPTSARTYLSATEAARLVHAAGRSSTTLLLLVEQRFGARFAPRDRPGHAATGLVPGADTRLRITSWAWTWRDGELAGVRPTVLAERLRGGRAGEAWELTVARHRSGLLDADGCDAGRDAGQDGSRAGRSSDHLCLAAAVPAGGRRAGAPGADGATDGDLRAGGALASAG